MKHSDTYNFTDSKLNVDSLQQRVYRRIKTLILTNKLQPGQTLNIDKLANEFGVSQTPVREALAMLKLDGLVIKGYHRTPTVAEIDEEDVREIYEVRIMIEGFAIKKVIGKLNNGDLDRLEEIITNIDDSDIEIYKKSLTRSDVDFHGFFISRVENSTFFRIYKSIEDFSLRIRTLVQNQTAENMEIITSEHRAILDSLRKKDAEAAYQNMVEHLLNARERTLKAMSSRFLE